MSAIVRPIEAKFVMMMHIDPSKLRVLQVLLLNIYRTISCACVTTCLYFVYRLYNLPFCIFHPCNSVPHSALQCFPRSYICSCPAKGSLSSSSQAYLTELRIYCPLPCVARFINHYFAKLTEIDMSFPLIEAEDNNHLKISQVNYFKYSNRSR